MNRKTASALRQDWISTTPLKQRQRVAPSTIKGRQWRCPPPHSLTMPSYGGLESPLPQVSVTIRGPELQSQGSQAPLQRLTSAKTILVSAYTAHTASEMRAALGRPQVSPIVENGYCYTHAQHVQAAPQGRTTQYVVGGHCARPGDVKQIKWLLLYARVQSCEPVGVQRNGPEEKFPSLENRGGHAVIVS